MKKWITFTAFLALATPASAKWHEASSEHFVIYADDGERNIREFAEDLERYHSALEVVLGWEQATPSPSNRLVIFVAGDQGDIRELAGTESRTIAGFYLPRAGASRAFVQDITQEKGYPSFSTTVLLHEYAHHFLISSLREAMPRWLSEGAAEFFASAGFNGDGSVNIGRPAMHRASELIYAKDVSVEELLDADLYEARKGKRYDAFYGRSWGLFHMLRFSDDRSGQLPHYIRLIADGKTSIEAGREAFGDLDQLQRDLDKYLKRKRLMNYVLQPDAITTSPITLRVLPDGEAAMMAVRMRSQRGVDEEEAAALVVEAREVAAQFPSDAAVQAALAEAEFDAGNDGAAVAAAEAALILDPANRNALVQKGQALFRQADDAADEATAYRQAMAPFTRLNALEKDHPLPLIYYYRSFVDRGQAPTDGAFQALERASQLAPFDMGLAMDVALVQAQQGKIAMAIQTLKPLAANPHGGELAESAKQYVAQLAISTEGEAWYPSPVLLDAAEAGEAAASD